MILKRKFIFLAFASSVLSLLIFSGTAVAVPQEETETSSMTLNLNEYSTLAITLSGDPKNVVCEGIVAGNPNALCNKYSNYGSGDYIRVIDYTGTDSVGHTVRMRIDSPTWVYNGSNPNYGDVAVSSNYNQNDVLVFILYMTSGQGYRNFSVLSGYTCTASTSTGSMVMTSRYFLTSDQIILSTSNSCPGSYFYTPYRFYGRAGNNGLGEGSYVNSGTYTLTDGY